MNPRSAARQCRRIYRNVRQSITSKKRTLGEHPETSLKTHCCKTKSFVPKISSAVIFKALSTRLKVPQQTTIEIVEVACSESTLSCDDDFKDSDFEESEKSWVNDEALLAFPFRRRSIFGLGTGLASSLHAASMAGIRTYNVEEDKENDASSRFYSKLNEFFQTDLFETETEKKPANTRQSKESPPKPSEENVIEAEVKFFGSKVDANGVLGLNQDDMNSQSRWKALGVCLSRYPSIKVLRLQGMEITKAEAVALERNGVLEKITGLRHIAFIDNSIGLNEGVLEVLVALLLACTLLESAAIQRNSLRDEHMHKLFPLLAQHGTLKRISLCWNGISDDGAHSLASRLNRVSSSLKCIDLSYNRIGDRGREAFKSYSFSQRPRPWCSVNIKHNRTLFKVKHVAVGRFWGTSNQPSLVQC